MNNFLYCFDNNYNLQAFSSMLSLLESVDQKINIYIIHKEERDSKFVPKKISNHKLLNKLEIYKFNKLKTHLPNLLDTHVSEATYYRLFLQDYLSKEIKFVTYLDADIICVNNPLAQINDSINKMKLNNFTIASKTEDPQSSHNNSTRLSLKSMKYLNAGVMIIDVQSWIDKNLKVKFIKIIEAKQEKLNLWDQDVLNIFFDGDYLELDKKLNYIVDLANYIYTILASDLHHLKLSYSEVVKDNIFIHFAGSHKPWALDGIACNLSEIYQKYFRKANKLKYHIVHKTKKKSVHYFLKYLLKGSYFSLKYPISFMFIFLISLFKK